MYSCTPILWVQYFFFLEAFKNYTWLFEFGLFQFLDSVEMPSWSFDLKLLLSSNFLISSVLKYGKTEEIIARNNFHVCKKKKKNFYYVVSVMAWKKRKRVTK